MKRVFIVHLLPLEYYPPVTNLLDILGADEQVKTAVYTTHNNKHRPVYSHQQVEIYRSTYPAYVKNKLQKIWAYGRYVMGPLWHLLRFQPDAVMYYEPHSAMPVYIYKKLMNRKARIFIHNHEYYATEDFKKPAMAAVRFFHLLERRYLYKKAVWISQTNEQRLQLFKTDYPFVDNNVLRSLANYPPMHWQEPAKLQKRPSDKIKLLYLGALSFENTYIEALVKYVSTYQDQLSLDIYSYNTSAEVAKFLETQNASNITYHKEGINYSDIPKIAAAYDIGVILYNGHNLNYTYNAPNKLFEYLACGLNVWVPLELEGCKPYLNENNRPVVQALDFRALSGALITDYYKTLNLPFVSRPYFCENELQTLIETLKA